MISECNQVRSPVVILAGGFGTRLRSVVPDLPKPMAPVHGKPFLEYMVRNLYRQGVREVILSLHHQAESVIGFIESNPFPSDLRIQNVVEPEPLGTGGAIRYATRDLKPDAPFFVCNGDTWITNGIGQFEPRAAKVSIGLVKVTDAQRYGAVTVDEAGRVTRFAEKENHSTAGWINAGIYHLNSSQLNRFAVGESFSIERDLFPELVQKKLIFASFLRSDFIDIGIPEDYAKFCRLVDQGMDLEQEGL